MNAQQLEAGLRQLSWKHRVKLLKSTVEEHHRAEELPIFIRRWLEANRAPKTEAEAAHAAREMASLQTLIDMGAPNQNYLGERSETVPISGWVIQAAHFLIDGKRWWLFSAQRHDDAAPMVGPTVPASANKADLHRLAKIIDYAGGNSKRELLRTGAITEEDRAHLIAAGHAEIADWGLLFYWWKA